ncbi:MAG: response regulator [Nitrospiraceae bacterium]|nr:response regulator [Nitrospiraceae bacterium]
MGGNRRAIVYDDDHRILNLLESFLSMKGYEVLCLSVPVVCPVFEDDEVQCLRESPCADIILTDYQMPGMNGMELMKRQSEKGCRIDIRNKALISGFAAALQTQVAEMGCAYFRKPFNLTELWKWISSCEERLPR